MYCSNCGSELSDNTKFCTHCGAATSPTTHQAPVSTKSKFPAWIIVVIAGIGILLLGLFITGLLLITKVTSKPIVSTPTATSAIEVSSPEESPSATIIPSTTPTTSASIENLSYSLETGTWWDTDSLRCSIGISQLDADTYNILVSWSSSSSEWSEWEMTASFDATSNSYTYSDGTCIDYYYGDDGEYSETIRYTNGTGKLYMDGAYLYWNDDLEEVRNGCAFEFEQNTYDTPVQNVSVLETLTADKLSPDERANINEVITIFPRCHFDTYNENTMAASPSSVIYFATSFLRLYAENAIVYDEDWNESIRTEDIDTILNNLFGKTVTHPVLDVQYNEWSYSNGIYTFPAASGENNGYVALLSYAEHLSDATIALNYTVFELDWEMYNYGDIDYSDYIALTAQEAYDYSELTALYTGRAIVWESSNGDIFVKSITTYR